MHTIVCTGLDCLCMISLVKREKTLQQISENIVNIEKSLKNLSKNELSLHDNPKRGRIISVKRKKTLQTISQNSVSM